ncbi:hypothetical protein BFP97_01105 [Roseivirga sp. 4D4]|uniref:hypothetical protein n=1 Tax=Roseivirga sp. 4D4 TaxID=1889784 RepID=UPI000852E712|nr:hypothetical protein [Roseivirga sp. 4D4]OEK00193.1 hypothetical protein BFP97_01105 [Roseivirga sp. 4D4]
MEFIEVLKERNISLFWFGTVNLLAAAFLIAMSFARPIDFAGTNAWHKPIKFALSTAILVWSVGWYTGYLPATKEVSIINWILITTLAFEVTYIAWKASKGEASHYNQSSNFHSFMFSMMALAASLATIAVAYIGLKFFATPLPDLPNYYVWAIRLGIALFVVFSFEGFVMGANMAHTVGGRDGTPGIPFLNWSLTYGDLRIAHFIGMHALQVIPILAWFVLRDTKLTIGISLLYALLAVFVLTQALRGKTII